MLTKHVAEARAILEGVPTGASAATQLPTAVRWILVQVRKDTKGRTKLLDGIKSIMEDIVERLTSRVRHMPSMPTKKGNGKKSATPELPSPPVPAAFDVKTMTPQELLTRTVEELDKNNSNAVSNAIDVVHYEEPFEEWLIKMLNENIHVSSGLGPWSCSTAVGSGEMAIRMRIAGEEQDEDTTHPGDTEEAHIAQVFKTVLGARSTHFNWSMDRTPHNWGGSSGDQYILNYDGKAEFAYRDGQAAIFATGNKPLLKIASKVLARATED